MTPAVFSYLDECILSNVTPSDYEEHLVAYCHYCLDLYSMPRKILPNKAAVEGVYYYADPKIIACKGFPVEWITEYSTSMGWDDILIFLARCFYIELRSLVEILRLAVRGKGTPNTLEYAVQTCSQTGAVITESFVPDMPVDVLYVPEFVRVLLKQLSVPSIFSPKEYYVIETPLDQSCRFFTLFQFPEKYPTKLQYQGYSCLGLNNTITGSALSF